MFLSCSIWVGVSALFLAVILLSVSLHSLLHVLQCGHVRDRVLADHNDYMYVCTHRNMAFECDIFAIYVRVVELKFE